jgi:hypothetical protein
MKRFVVFLALACLLFSGIGGGLWADEQIPPPDPGLGGGSLDDDEPGGDDHPWGGEDRSPGETDGGGEITVVTRDEVSSLTAVTAIPACDIWFGIYRTIIEPQVLSNLIEEKAHARDSRRFVKHRFFSTRADREGR